MIAFTRATLGLAAAFVMLMANAQAAEKLRVGKAVPEAFSFVPIDIGMRKGIFAKHGLELESIAFAGDARMQQAAAADSIDILLGSGPAMAFIAKGAPIKAVAAMAGPPLLLAIVVRPDGPKTAADLKGKKISVSTAGSLTYWLVSETSRRQGWGPSGIQIQPMGAMPGQIAALKRGDIDGVIMDIGNAFDLEKRGEARILVRFGDIKDFHIHVIFATDKVIAGKPEAVRGFLKGWFETIAFMRGNKADTVAIAKEVTNKSEDIVSRSYDELMTMFSDTGRFDPKALEVLRKSYVELAAPAERAGHVEALHGSVPAEMTAGDAAIRIKDVSHQFGEPGETHHVRALLHTSLDVARGELLCLIGPSGCGKSTLLNVIGGLLLPTTGTVEVSRTRVRGPLPREIAFVFQENALFPWCTVIENVKLGMVFQGVPRHEHEERARKALEAVGLKDFLAHYPAQLSGGMRQRAALARALSLETGILLDGRAVRCARRADPHDPGRRPFRAVGAHRKDHRVRYPFARRGGVPGRPRGGVFGAAGDDQGSDRRGRAASAQSELRHHGEIPSAAQQALHAPA